MWKLSSEAPWLGSHCSQMRRPQPWCCLHRLLPSAAHAAISQRAGHPLWPRRAQLAEQAPGGGQLAPLAAQCAALEGALAALAARVEQSEQRPPVPAAERAVKQDISLLMDAVQVGCTPSCASLHCCACTGSERPGRGGRAPAGAAARLLVRTARHLLLCFGSLAPQLLEEKSKKLEASSGKAAAVMELRKEVQAAVVAANKVGGLLCWPVGLSSLLLVARMPWPPCMQIAWPTAFGHAAATRQPTKPRTTPPHSTPAGGEAEAVAASFKSFTCSIQALQSEVAAATAGSSEARQRAAGAAEAAAALEQQVRSGWRGCEAASSVHCVHA